MKLSRLSLLALVACSDPTNITPTELNLNRPVDVAFACYGGLRLSGGEGVTTTAQPVQSCTIRSGERTGDPPVAPVPAGQEDTDTEKVGGAKWYAFILQSAPGTVAVAQFNTVPGLSFSGSDINIIDADPLTPGKNSISVGEDPIAIATDKVGCFEVIANAGSCDLSKLDVNSAVQALTDGTMDPLVERMDVKNALGEVIRARPAAMAFEPAGGVIGARCPATPTGLAYIAYPSCHLVAGVDVSTGTIVTGVQFDANGVANVVDSNVTCPAECDGAPITPGVRPVAIDLELDERTGRAVLAIGADNSKELTIFELDNQSFRPLSKLPAIVLEDKTGRLGLTTVAISPVIGMGGTMGVTSGVIDDGAPGSDHQFVYAVANDGSVRVAEILGAPRECDAQVDPRYLRDVRDVDRLSCFAVGAPTTPPRRAGARSPGIELIGDAIPTSVDFAKVDKLPMSDARSDPYRMVGYFAMVSASNGRVYVVNVDDDAFADFVDPSRPIGTEIPLDIPHQLRDAVDQRGLLAEKGTNPAQFVCNDPGLDPDVQGNNKGGPRLTGALQRTLPAGTIAPEKVGGLPSIRQVFCDAGDPMEQDRPVNELFFSAPVDVREEVFPDLRALRSDEVWSITYEGPLSADKADTSIDGPAVRMSQLVLDSAGFRIVDETRPFCDAGVEPYDIAQLRGCDPTLGDAGCPIGYTCYVHPQSQIGGLGACLLKNEAERLSTTCSAYLRSVRRYTVGRTKSGELQLLPRKVALRTTPLDGCTDDAQCESLADYALQNASSTLPGDPNLPTDPKTWRCAIDPDRRPMPATSTGKRCLLTCNADTDCSFGTVCQDDPAAAPQKGYCMEGVVPPPACINGPQKYDLRAGEAFTVLGSRQGYIHPIIADAGDVCVRDPNANTFEIGRIPLDPPPCDPTADPITNRRADGTFGPNPCKELVAETEYQLRYVPNTCTLDDPDEDLVTRDATGLRFRNPALNLTIVDPVYQGDLMCHGDRAGMLVNVPLVMQGFQIAFRIAAGFTPLVLAGISPAFPVKVVRGPTNSFWVIDEGDFISTSPSQSSTRGKVFRVEGQAINKITVLQ